MESFYRILFHTHRILLVLSIGFLVWMLLDFYSKTQNYSHNILAEWFRKSVGSGKNKRRTDRVKCDILVELLNGPQVTATGRVLNMSTKGACFVSTLPLRVGDMIMLRLPAMRNNENNLLARVVWRRMSRVKILYGVLLNPTISA